MYAVLSWGEGGLQKRCGRLRAASLAGVSVLASAGGEGTRQEDAAAAAASPPWFGGAGVFSWAEIRQGDAAAAAASPPWFGGAGVFSWAEAGREMRRPAGRLTAMVWGCGGI